MPLARGVPTRPTGPTRPAWADAAVAAMRSRGVSTADMAALVGLSPRALSGRLAGRVRPLTSEMRALAAALELPLEALVGARPLGWEVRRGPTVELLTGRDRRVYAAAGRVPSGAPLRTVTGVQSYVDSILGRPWWRTLCPETSAVRVTGGGGGGTGAPAWHESSIEPEGLSHVLHMPRWSRRPLTVLHELAHVVVEPILWARPHGPQFVRAWIDLVTEMMGPDRARALTGELRIERIRPGSRVGLLADRQRGLAALAEMLGRGLHERRGGER
jgi:putative metallohydrolase (TIGR04338 family)